MKKRKKKGPRLRQELFCIVVILASQSTFLIRAGSMRLTKSARIKVKFEETRTDIAPCKSEEHDIVTAPHNGFPLGCIIELF